MEDEETQAEKTSKQPKARAGTSPTLEQVPVLSAPLFECNESWTRQQGIKIKLPFNSLSSYPLTSD